MLNKITGFFSDKKIKAEQIEQLQKLLWQVVSDGVITDEELELLRHFNAESVLTPEESYEVRDAVFSHVLSSFMADRRLSQTERNSIMNIATRLGVSSSRMAEVHSLVDYYSLLETFQTCPFNQLPHNAGASGILLQKGEMDYFCHSANLLEERVVRSQVVGRSSGVSIRIMKGVSYRVGQSRGTIQSERDWVPVSLGDFVITNQRLIFSGDRKSVNAPLSKLLDVDVLADGIRFSLTNRQKAITVQFFTPQSTEIAATVLSRVLNQ